MTPPPEFELGLVIPTLNQGPFLRTCLDSICQQDGPFGIQVAIQDGLSQDSTHEVWEAFRLFLLSEGGATTDSGIFVPHGPNILPQKGIHWTFLSEKDSGQSEAINKGLKRLTAPLVNWLCSDDYLLPGALQLVWSRAELSPKFAVFFGMVLYRNLTTGEEVEYRSVMPSSYQLLKKNQGLHQTAAFFRRELISRLGPVREDLHYCMDTELYLRWYFAGVRFQRIESRLSVQCIHAASKTGSETVMFQKFGKENAEVRAHYLANLPIRFRLELLTEKTFEALGQIVHKTRSWLSKKLKQ